MPVSVEVLPDEHYLAVERDQLIKAQQSDNTLATCLFAAQEQNSVAKPAAYLFNDGVLLRKWSPVPGRECDVVTQVVVPKELRFQVLSLAHNHGMPDHLGIKKNLPSGALIFFLTGVKV